MTIALWVAQVLGAAFFVMHGVMFQNPERARARLPYARALGVRTLRAIGALEILGGVGLIVPALTGILPWLTSFAGVGLAVIMILAIPFHIVRREWPNIGLNLVLGTIAAFVAYGRFVIEPVGAR